MTAIAGDNPVLDKTRLGRVVDRVSNIKMGGAETRRLDRAIADHLKSLGF